MLEILFSLIVILIMIIIIPLMLNYNYQIKFKYENSFVIFFLISTSFYSYQIIRYSEENFSINESNINIFGIKKKYINKKEKDRSNNKNNNQEKVEEDKKDDKTKINNIKENFSIGAAFLSKENLRHVFYFVSDLLQELKSDKFTFFLNISLSDPYYNGLILAYYYSIKSILELKNFEIEIDWLEPKLKADSIIKGEIIPIKMLITVFRFVFSLQSIRLLTDFIKIRRKNKNAKK